jgi:serine/threonine protein kinase
LLNPVWQERINEELPEGIRSSGSSAAPPAFSDFPNSPRIDDADLTQFVDCLIAESCKLTLPASDAIRESLKLALIGSLYDLAYSGETASCSTLAKSLCELIYTAFNLKTPEHKAKLDTFVLDQLQQFVKTQGKSRPIVGANLAAITGTEVFSSEWLEHLRSRGILMGPEEELDWSGRGQHVEYAAKEEKDIPLRAEKILGHSATALVESVMCRRIRLARKRIRCGRSLSKEDAITEVEHLQRLQHSHVIRVVGTYTLKKDLAILLYPAAEWNLEEFMEDTMDVCGQSEWEPRSEALVTFFGCLGSTIEFLHDQNVKHMDIKPKNILVRPIESGNATQVVPAITDREGKYKVYLADFGIARAYQSPADVETDSPTSFTRTYAAPEVVGQDKRGFSADIFSLGCVYLEMLATLLSDLEPMCNERLKLQKLRCNENGDTSYHANIKALQEWCDSKSQRYLTLSGMHIRVGRMSSDYPELLPRMISKSPNLRPDARTLSASTRWARCSRCTTGPEPFEAAKPLPT